MMSKKAKISNASIQEKSRAIEAADRELIDTPRDDGEAERKKEIQNKAADIRSRERPEGRYSIYEAIVLLLAETGEYFRVGKAAWDGDLRSHAPGCGKHKITTSNNPNNWTNYDNTDEVYWYDLNAWIEKEFPAVGYKFPKPADSPKVSKGKAGRPKIVDKRVDSVRDMIAKFERVALTEFTPHALNGSAANLLDACQRYEKNNNIKPVIFNTTQDTFNSWLRRAGYRFPTGRTLDIEKDYWTQLVVKVRD